MPGTDEAPDVSVVVVTWNSAAAVGGCLRSLPGAAGDLRLEVIVVDNASTDGTADVVEAAAPGASLIRNDRNRGLPAANNQGLARANAPRLLICNPDVVFEAGSIAEMGAALDRIPAAGWVVPRLLYEDGSAQESTGRLPTLTDALLGRQWARRRGTGLWEQGGQSDEERRVGRGHEAAYLIRRRAYEEVGPQDERYVLDWEGVDWAERFARRGWETWIVPSARVVHLGGTSIRQVPFRWVVRQHTGMYLYFSSRRPVIWKPVLAAVISLRAAVKLALTGLRLPMYQLAHGKGR